MQKIPTLYHRTFKNNIVVNCGPEITAGCEWVFTEPNVIPSRKRDGMCIMIAWGQIYKRYDCKKNDKPPEHFIPCGSPEDDHWPGWVPWSYREVEQIYGLEIPTLFDGTYELCGPKVGTRAGANPERLKEHMVYAHGSEPIPNKFTNLETIKNFLLANPMEGIVFYRQYTRKFENYIIRDSWYAKIKSADLGIQWP